MFDAESLKFKDVKENERFYDLNMNEYIKDTILVFNAVRVLDNHRTHFEPDDRVLIIENQTIGGMICLL